MTTSERTLTAPRRAFTRSMPMLGDKSLSHRALILAGMACGESEVTGRPDGADVASTVAALKRLGVDFDGARIRSGGVGLWRGPPGTLDAGNSGTTLRLLAGALAGRPFPSTLSGDASLLARPMRRLVAPLEALGASVTISPEGTPPVTVQAVESLRGTEHETELASAQVRSAFQFAALQAVGDSKIDSPPGFRDHTERWLGALGLGEWVDDTAFVIHPGAVPPASYPVPGDPSSAAFLWAAAALQPGAVMETPGVSLNAGRTGFLGILEEFGAEVDREVTGEVHGDPVGRVAVRGGSLGKTKVTGTLTVQALDELPLVAVVAGAGEGPTKVADAGELRAKESDRIASTVAMIRALGGIAEATEDGFVVEGAGGYRGGVVDSQGDHRIAMAAAVAAGAATGPVTVVGADSADVSFPKFYDVLEWVWS